VDGLVREFLEAASRVRWQNPGDVDGLRRLWARLDDRQLARIARSLLGRDRVLDWLSSILEAPGGPRNDPGDERLPW
jgi:hypothetical protein